MILQATLEEARQLGDILQDWIEATPWMPKLHTRAETHDFLGHLAASCAVYIAGRPPTGFLVLDGHDVRCLYLAEAARGQGLGKRLLGHAKAERDQLELWTFQANDGARRFYAREGFIEVEWTDGAGNEEKLPDVRLTWQR